MARRMYDLSFCLLMGTLFSFALSLAVLEATVFTVHWVSLLGWCGCVVAVWYLLLFNRYTRMVTLIGLVVTAVILLYTFRQGGADTSWYRQLEETVRQLYWFFVEPDLEQGEYIALITAGICIAVSSVTALNIKFYFNFYLLAFMGFVVLATPVLLGYGTSPLAGTIYAFCFLVFLCKQMNLLSIPREGARGRDNQSAALKALPFCLVAMGLALLLPSPDLDMNYSFSPMDIWNRAEELVFGGRAKGFTSFSDTSQLGGPIDLGNDFVMEVKAGERLYLAGGYKDTYTGSGWTESKEGGGKARLESDDGRQYNTSPYSDELQRQQQYYMRFYGRTIQQVTINMGDNRTSTIFTPPSHLSMEAQYDLGLWQNGLGALGGNSNLRRNADYTQEYISWNYNNIYFVAMLQSLPARAGGEEMSRYLALPDTLPHRVAQLAGELTEGIPDDYGKVMALTNYLARFPYTLEPDQVPRDEDLVDYFLFDGQEGYCVYYASALAVMARSLGIPARYVEGFVMPQESDNGVYTVTTAYAHAWVEVWFDGFGWLAVEPTAPYYSGRYGAEASPEAADTPEVEQRPENPAGDEMEMDGAQAPETEQGQSDPQEEGISGPKEEEEELTGRTGIPWGILLVAAAVAALFILRRHQWQRIDRMSNRQAAEALYGAIINAAHLCGHPREVGETVHQYISRVEGALPIEEVELSRVTEIFSRASFSRDSIIDEERALMREVYLRLLRRFKADPRHWPGLAVHCCLAGPWEQIREIWPRWAKISRIRAGQKKRQP